MEVATILDAASGGRPRAIAHRSPPPAQNPRRPARGEVRPVLVARARAPVGSDASGGIRPEASGGPGGCGPPWASVASAAVLPDSRARRLDMTLAQTIQLAEPMNSIAIRTSPASIACPPLATSQPAQIQHAAAARCAARVIDSQCYSEERSGQARRRARDGTEAEGCGAGLDAGHRQASTGVQAREPMGIRENRGVIRSRQAGIARQPRCGGNPRLSGRAERPAHEGPAISIPDSPVCSERGQELLRQETAVGEGADSADDQHE